MGAYCFDCDCGRRIEVSAAQAGAEATCACGRRPTVPRLGELRALAGEGEFESGAIDTIQRMIAAGDLPGAATCVVTGFPTNNIAQVQVQCEQTWRTGTGSWGRIAAVIALLFLPLGVLWAFLFATSPRRPAEEHGRDRSIRLPLRIEVEAVRRLSRGGQRELQRVLRTVPAYGRLLEEYPNASIKIVYFQSSESR